MTCCKTLDIANGSKRKTASVILKRGRTILKNRCDSKKHSLRNSLSSKMITSGQDLHKLKPEDVNIIASPCQNGFDLSPDSSLAIENTTPSAKKAIKLEDKLISGEEIEICPTFRIDNRRTECVADETDVHLVNENSRQAKISGDESSKLYLNLNNFESNKSHSSINSDKSPIIAEDYPKLYITVTNLSDKEAVTKNSLLKNIRSIQNADRDAYGINISNSRFFVPKDYVFSGIECVMNDLKFEVDPEMGKLLQRSYSNPQISTNSPGLIDIETGPSFLDNTMVSSETSIALNNSAGQRNEDSNFKYLRTLSDTSLVNLRLKESNRTEQRQKLFLNKRESKPSHEVIDSLLGETTSKSETSAALQIRNIESLNKLDDHVNLHESEEKSREMKYGNCKFFPSKVSHSRDETVKQETCYNQLWTAKSVIIDDEKITTKSASDILEKSEISNSSDKNIAVNINSLKFEKIKSPYDTSNAPLMRSKSYPLISSTKVPSASRCLSSISIIPPCQTLRIYSENEKKNSESFKCSSIDQKKQIELSSCNKKIQKSENSNLRETNRIRLNRIKFLQSSLQASVSENDSQIENVAPSESKLCIINETSQSIDLESDRNKDQPLPMGRTSSLREKFETIMEDVELRTTSGRRSQISKSCDRKSLC